MKKRVDKFFGIKKLILDLNYNFLLKKEYKKIFHPCFLEIYTFSISFI